MLLLMSKILFSNIFYINLFLKLSIILYVKDYGKILTGTKCNLVWKLDLSMKNLVESYLPSNKYFFRKRISQTTLNDRVPARNVKHRVPIWTAAAVFQLVPRVSWSQQSLLAQFGPATSGRCLAEFCFSFTLGRNC